MKPASLLQSTPGYGSITIRDIALPAYAPYELCSASSNWQSKDNVTYVRALLCNQHWGLDGDDDPPVWKRRVSGYVGVSASWYLFN